MRLSPDIFSPSLFSFEISSFSFVAPCIVVAHLSPPHKTLAKYCALRGPLASNFYPSATAAAAHNDRDDSGASIFYLRRWKGAADGEREREALKKSADAATFMNTRLFSGHKVSACARSSTWPSKCAGQGRGVQASDMDATKASFKGNIRDQNGLSVRFSHKERNAD